MGVWIGQQYDGSGQRAMGVWSGQQYGGSGQRVMGAWRVVNNMMVVVSELWGYGEWSTIWW